MSVSVIHADSRDALRDMADASVDAVVSDPPYFLTSIVKRFGGQNSAPNQFGADGRFKRLSGGFMNQTWDAPPPPVIDPGFAHWMAGFIDGEGCFHVHKKTVNGCQTYDCQFSMSLRADDKPILVEMQQRLGGIGSIADRPAPSGSPNAKRQVRYCISAKADCERLRAILSVFPLRAKKARDFEIWSQALDAWLRHEPGGGWDDIAYYRDALMAVRNFGSVHRPERLFFYGIGLELLRVMKPGAHLVMSSGTRTYHHMVCGLEDAGFEVRDCIAWLHGQGFPKSHSVERATGDPAHAGLGTALKPAMELIVLARKPLIGTVASNVLAHGTGALNIDASRIEAPDGVPVFTLKGRDAKHCYGDGLSGSARTGAMDTTKGRWPANVIHDGSEEVLAHFPETESGTFNGNRNADTFRNAYGEFKGTPERETPFEGSTGSAARFFYTAKADADDRLGSKHPTVKPVDLMAYLIKLVTPPGGLVLDPFAGSGTTGMACMREGFRAVLIERELEYYQDILRRLDHVKGADTPLFSARASSPEPQPEMALPLCDSAGTTSRGSIDG